MAPYSELLKVGKLSIEFFYEPHVAARVIGNGAGDAFFRGQRQLKFRVLLLPQAGASKELYSGTATSADDATVGFPYCWPQVCEFSKPEAFIAWVLKNPTTIIWNARSDRAEDQSALDSVLQAYYLEFTRELDLNGSTMQIAMKKLDVAANRLRTFFKLLMPTSYETNDAVRQRVSISSRVVGNCRPVMSRTSGNLLRSGVERPDCTTSGTIDVDNNGLFDSVTVAKIRSSVTRIDNFNADAVDKEALLLNVREICNGLADQILRLDLTVAEEAGPIETAITEVINAARTLQKLRQQ
jgi:hypothetical protein